MMNSTVSYIPVSAAKRKQTEEIREAPTPTKTERIWVRFMILLGLAAAVFFFGWFFQREHAGFAPLYILLCISLIYKLLRILFEWYHYWAIGKPTPPPGQFHWTVDMFTTAMPGEPYDMIKATLTAMKEVRYPHTSYLCDEGNDPVLKELCARLGVVHVTRTEKIHAKAGNINNALKRATGDICVILDPDHQPLPGFLDEVLPYFKDPHIGYVQVVQAYKNTGETLIAKGAAQQTYTFYGPMMMCMGSYGTAQAIGANCTFRRSALDSIGGHAPGLSEDMHTAMQLHAKGWKSVYVPKIVTRGLVPSSMAGYYKQQLKWSRGTFDLLFHVYPKLVKNFSWRQKIHYFFLPLHYLAGLIVLIDILIPVLALFSGQTPLLTNLDDLAIAALPLLALVLLTRQFAQRWLLEKHELGLHFTGGALLFGSWWVFLTGLIYTFLGIQVPYIPTPKEDEAKNNLILSIPNIAMCLLSLAAIGYGLWNDLNPYNLIMAGYALVNTTMLLIIILAGQHLSIHFLKGSFNRLRSYKTTVAFYRKTSKLSFPLWHEWLSKAAPAMALLVLLTSFGLKIYTDRNEGQQLSKEFPQERQTGGFYSGVYFPETGERQSLAAVERFEKETRNRMQVVSLYAFWGWDDLKKTNLDFLNKIAAKGSIPMITWEPWISGLPESLQDTALRQEKGGMRAIAEGRFDNYIRAFALQLRDFEKPVFVRFAHEADNPAYPWSKTGENTAEDYKAAWKKVVALFVSLGVSNVTWVYTPWNPSTMNDYYPGDQYVDWIGVTSLNYGSASYDGKWRSFKEVYEPNRGRLLSFHKPVMLAEFGSTNYGGDAGEWLADALQKIHYQYKEIKSVVFFNSSQDKNWINSWRPSDTTRYIDWSVKDPALVADGLATCMEDNDRLAHLDFQRLYAHPVKKDLPRSPVAGGPGGFQLLVAGKPFYVKGVAYNTGPDWRDGVYPLTRHQLQHDFQAIKAMGANTIRRYQPGLYDRSILHAAEGAGLKVLYGFWFDPTVDYYSDTQQVKKYISRVEETVQQYKGSAAVLAWSIGNETSGLLKKYYEQPYLNMVRRAYMNMIEQMARRIHRIDPERAVTTSLEHSWQLSGELYAYSLAAPGVDVMAVNSYYTQQLSQVQKLTQEFDPGRPYLISEFGPKGYWNPELSQFDRHQVLVEDDDALKAALYQQEWGAWIQGNQGLNIGGIAYCWRDRYEGTATWFGITDYKGRKKPVYYALQRAWKTRPLPAPASKLFLVGPDFLVKNDLPYRFKALSNDARYDRYEWKLYLNDYVKQEGSIDVKESGSVAEVSVPWKDGHYRLYVYATDREGNVLTASKSIKLYREGEKSIQQ